MQIKTTVRYPIMPFTMAINQNQNQNPNPTTRKIANVDKDVEKVEPVSTIGGNIKWWSCYGKQ